MAWLSVLWRPTYSLQGSKPSIFVSYTRLNALWQFTIFSAQAMILNTDNILNHFRGYKPNDLSGKLSLYDEETNEIPTISLSPHLTSTMIPNYLKDYGHSFAIMSLNCQSINAKFGLLEAMLYRLLQPVAQYVFKNLGCLVTPWLIIDLFLSFLVYQKFLKSSLHSILRLSSWEQTTKVNSLCLFSSIYLGFRYPWLLHIITRIKILWGGLTCPSLVP